MPNFLSAKVVSPAVADVIILPSSKEYQARSASISNEVALSGAQPPYQRLCRSIRPQALSGEGPGVGNKVNYE